MQEREWTTKTPLEEENWLVRVWKKVLESSSSVGGKCYEERRRE